MGVRNCAEIGENLQRIVTRLLSNENLCKLLYYTNKDPLSGENIDQNTKTAEIFNKLIRVVPKVTAEEQENSIIAITVATGTQNRENSEFEDISILVEVFVPFTQWIIKDSNLRPFAILGELQKSLNDKTINGLGKMVGGDFTLKFLTEETSCYEQSYKITQYD